MAAALRSISTWQQCLTEGCVPSCSVVRMQMAGDQSAKSYPAGGGPASIPAADMLITASYRPARVLAGCCAAALTNLRCRPP